MVTRPERRAVCRHRPLPLPGGPHGPGERSPQQRRPVRGGLDRPTSTLFAGSHPPMGKTDSARCCHAVMDEGGSDGPGDAIAFAVTLTGGTSPRATPRRNPGHRPVGSPDVDAQDDDRHVAECRMPVAVLKHRMQVGATCRPPRGRIAPVPRKKRQHLARNPGECYDPARNGLVSPR